MLGKRRNKLLFSSSETQHFVELLFLCPKTTPAGPGCLRMGLVWVWAGIGNLILRGHRGFVTTMETQVLANVQLVPGGRELQDWGTVHFFSGVQGSGPLILT